MSPRTGRPTDCPKTKQIVVRFDEETLKILDAFCEKNKITRVEGIRQAVRQLPKEK